MVWKFVFGSKWNIESNESRNIIDSITNKKVYSGQEIQNLEDQREKNLQLLGCLYETKIRTVQTVFYLGFFINKKLEKKQTKVRLWTVMLQEFLEDRTIDSKEQTWII